MSYTSHHLGIATILICGFLWQSFQSRLHVTGEDTASSFDKNMADAGTQTPASSACSIIATTDKCMDSDISGDDNNPSVLATFPVPAPRPAATAITHKNQAVASTDQVYNGASTLTVSPMHGVVSLSGMDEKKTPPASKGANVAEQGREHQDFQQWFKEFSEAADQAKPIHAPYYIVEQIKGYSSHILREEVDFLIRQLPCLWTRTGAAMRSV